MDAVAEEGWWTEHCSEDVLDVGGSGEGCNDCFLRLVVSFVCLRSKIERGVTRQHKGAFVVIC